MEDPRQVQGGSSPDGADQSAEQDGSPKVCTSQVHGANSGDGDWPRRPGCDLTEEAYYRIKGGSLNHLYRSAVTNFNHAGEHHDKRSAVVTYTEAFWNGYACAIATVRDTARYNPIDSEV